MRSNLKGHLEHDQLRAQPWAHVTANKYVHGLGAIVDLCRKGLSIAASGFSRGLESLFSLSQALT